MRKGLLTLLALLVAGAGVSRAQSYPGNHAFPAANTADQPAPAPPPFVSEPPIGAEPQDGPGCFGEPEREPGCFWFTADYLLWWTKDGPLPDALVTTGPLTAPILGGLTQPGTQVLVGGSDQDYGAASGLRLTAGAWLGTDRRWGVEGSWFLLARQSTGLSAVSDFEGSPVLAQPLIAPGDGEFTELVALPGFIQGGASVTTHSRLQGWELNALLNVCRGDRLTFDLIGGFRSLSLDEDLQIFTAFSPLVSQFLSFQGQLVNAPSTLTTFDSFQASNHFYGPQLGGQVGWSCGKFGVTAIGKVAAGDNQELVRVAGASSLSTPGAGGIPIAGTPLLLPVATTTPATGGVLALPTNSGRHFRDEFTVVPEVNLQLSYHVSHDLEVHVGYSFLYCSEVLRPGNQLDRTVTAGLVPTDPLFGTMTGTRPAFQFHSSDYWAQGLNFGLTVRF